MKENQLIEVQQNLETMISEKLAAMPRGFNQTRFIQNCLTVCNDLKDVDNIKPESVARCMIKGAFLGLDFFYRECYAIPYMGEINFQTDYKGEKKLAKKYAINPILDIYAKLVRVGDKFEEKIIDGRQSIDFEPIPFNNAEILGAFAIALMRDGSMQYDVMSTDEIEAVKVSYSKKSHKTGAYSPAWEKSKGEMYKKTVYRRLCKNIELEFDSIEQKKVWDETSEMEFTAKKETQIAASSLDNVIDIEPEPEIIKEELF